MGYSPWGRKRGGHGSVTRQQHQLCVVKNIFTIENSFFFSFILISWRLITLQYCSGKILIASIY